MRGALRNRTGILGDFGTKHQFGQYKLTAKRSMNFFGAPKPAPKPSVSPERIMEEITKLNGRIEAGELQ